MVLSQNGWSANDISQTANYTIGNDRIVRLRRGDAGFLLKHFADWFDKNVEDIDIGADDWGYAERTIRGDATTLSNHASGTAIDLNATKHPLGKRGTFTAAQTFKIRNQLKVYGGAIRWGGDYTGRPDEMHFEINANAATVGKVATNLRAAKVAAGQPTYLDVTVALAKFAATTKNERAKPVYQRARTIVGHLVKDGRKVRVPETTAEVIAVLAAKRAATKNYWTRFRLSTVIRILRPLA
jgi:hypothetical protein